jgi:glycosyltransferase involved in cell wall biosynthesis
MAKAKRIFIVADIKYKPIKVFVDQIPKLAKGFVRLGHDVRLFSYCNVLEQMSPVRSRGLSALLFKTRADELLAAQIKSYEPHVIYINFPRSLDADSIRHIRKVAPNAVLVGDDGDPWPKLQRNRIETAKELDIVAATNAGEFLQDYRDAGVPNCVFLPNICDPDNDHRYEVHPKWNTDILWTGKVTHHASTSGAFREQLVTELAKRHNCAIYGCFTRPQIGGIDYLHAISGARIGVNVNAYRSIRLCHSDRLTHYLACGTFVLADRIPDADVLFKDTTHLKYFDTIEEFFELADYYLKHEKERAKIADAGMHRAHTEFNCVKIAKYVLELADTGTYKAPWSEIL